MYISVTKLTLKNIFRIFRFMKYTIGAYRQASLAEGNLHAATKNQFFKHFWTLTAWESKQHMQNYLRSESHMEAMKEASSTASFIYTYGYEADHLPTWKEAVHKLQVNGIRSKSKFILK